MSIVSEVITVAVSEYPVRSLEEVIGSLPELVFSHIDEVVLPTMPRGTTAGVKFALVKLAEMPPHETLELDLLTMGFILADPFTCLHWNAANQTIDHVYPNGVMWRDEFGEYCTMVVGGFQKTRNSDIDLSRNSKVWGSDVWLFCQDIRV